MKNFTRSLILISIGTFFSLSAFVRTSFAQSPEAIQITIPAAAVELEGLDARDFQNRPVKNFNAVNSFRRLWVQSLNQRLLLSLTPLKLIKLAALEALWDRFTSALKNRFSKIKHLVVGWFQNRERILASIAWLFLAKVQTSGFTMRPSISNPYCGYMAAVISSTRLIR